MSVDFKHSVTKENLMRAFAGESQARNRYTMAAEQAKKQGLYAVSEIFLFTASQEKEHASIFYNHLKECAGETIHIDGGYPVDISEKVSDLLRFAEHNEFEEHDDVYKNFEDKAREEDFDKIAGTFHMIAAIEKTHGERFQHIAELLEQGRLYASETESVWLCLECGNIYRGTSVPEACPVCGYDRGYYIPLYLAPYTCRTN